MQRAGLQAGGRRICGCDGPSNDYRIAQLKGGKRQRQPQNRSARQFSAVRLHREERYDRIAAPRRQTASSLCATKLSPGATAGSKPVATFKKPRRPLPGGPYPAAVPTASCRMLAVRLPLAACTLFDAAGILLSISPSRPRRPPATFYTGRRALIMVLGHRERPQGGLPHLRGQGNCGRRQVAEKL
jgi:hypothetical protein